LVFNERIQDLSPSDNFAWHCKGPELFFYDTENAFLNAIDDINQQCGSPTLTQVVLSKANNGNIDNGLLKVFYRYAKGCFGNISRS
jgi:hypothetical protein